MVTKWCSSQRRNQPLEGKVQTMRGLVRKKNCLQFFDTKAQKWSQLVVSSTFVKCNFLSFLKKSCLVSSWQFFKMHVISLIWCLLSFEIRCAHSHTTNLNSSQYFLISNRSLFYFLYDNRQLITFAVGSTLDYTINPNIW